MKSLSPPQRKRFPGAMLACALVACGLTAQLNAQVSTKVVTTFAPQDWTTSSDNRAPADYVALDDSGMEAQIAYSGKGFEYHRMAAKNPISIPGKLKTVQVQIHMSNPGAGTKLTLIDAYGGWHNIDFPKFASESWETVTIPVPDDLAQPATIHSFQFHNWGTRKQKTDVRVGLKSIAVETDLTYADPMTGRYLDWKPDPSGKKKDTEAPATPLFSADFSSTAPGHFFAGTDAELILNIRNWRPNPAQVKATVTVTDIHGENIFTKTIEQRVDASEQFKWSPPVELYGPHRAEVQIENAGFPSAEAYLIFAEGPKPHDLTESEKMASPYGMNVHGGQGLFITPFRNAGIIWFRDYAFNFEWLERAKQNSRNFSGWPGYPGIVQTYKDAGAMVLPVLAHSIPRPEIVNGHVEGNTPPSRPWVAHLAEVLDGFPQFKYWELDNEYALEPEIREAEKKLNWAHYESYHKAFGDAVKLLGFGELKAVENGRAGIFPDLLEKAVKNGSFENINVVNIHHYAGVDTPELNVKNYNTGGLGRGADLLFDKLRDVVAAAHADGKEREAFITEFGWDTAAGQVVSIEQQAAYAPRSYMMFAAAGMDKAFWYWHFDSSTPMRFFDACGLMTARREPKPSLCTVAGITHLLPSLDYVGTFNFGPGTEGYVFKENGQYIAAAFRILDGDKPIEVDFGADVQLYDAYANPLQGTQATLDIAPIYADGLKPDSAIMRQAAYSIDSHRFMATVANEASDIVVRVNNLSGQNKQVTLKPVLPSGWKNQQDSFSYTASAYSDDTITIPFKAAADAKAGFQPLSVEVVEDGKALTTLYLRANVLEPYVLTVGGMPNTEGKVEVVATVINQTNSVKTPSIALSLPSGWHALTEDGSIDILQPQETREIPLEFEWSNGAKLDRLPQVTLQDAEFKITQSIIPPFKAIRKLEGSGWFKGDTTQWPEANKLPEWIVGSIFGEPLTNIWMGWSGKGLWIGVDVKASKVQVTGPRSFWQADSLELFIDAQNDKTATSFGPGDHQFWAVAQPEEDCVYLGEWKRSDEIEETRYDIPLSYSASKRTEDGYTMEFIIPWSEIRGFTPRAGKDLGLNFNLNVKGIEGSREVYWPRVKTKGIIGQPKFWGTVELSQ
ncbi:sugar-binding protein [Coraliomargarita algicola]|uniref:Sugar-binding protein n=1 Tax=Coraliomargarita algicola TaxID=3092156 RepID=A0ABZ0RLG5_9BACT|nr:sugar-binding protein [Coraliomargarita sp. J2-16]WPJ95845.1 sugar-binding protein [Coraliomargarita sp. J2-16]